MKQYYETLRKVADRFGIKDNIEEIFPIVSGHINSTYRVELKSAQGESYSLLFQKINISVFKNADRLMQNIDVVTSHLRKKIEAVGGDPDRETIFFAQADDGKRYAVINGDEYWRICNYIEDSYSCDNIDEDGIFFNAGAAFGKFQMLLSDLPGDMLFETIPDFHNTAKRFKALKEAVEKDAAGRAQSVKAEIEFAYAREKDCSVLTDMAAAGELPIRVTHNDTKLNNILFDKKTKEGICIVDLDTVMPGLSLYDFGDSIRFGANTAAEDEKDLSKVSLSLPLYTEYTRGYLSTAGDSLTEKEIEYLPFSAKIMTYECGIRFLTDYLNGDIYFKTEYPEHNLDRCHTQFALVEDIEKKLDEMSAITRETAAKYKKATV